MKKIKRKVARMTGGQAFFEVMVSEGLEYLFGNPGSTGVAILDNLKAYPQVKYIMGLHENIPIEMADGYARASGKIGVVNVHAIEGVCNAMAGLYNAFHSGGKIVLVTGRADTDAIMREGLWYDDSAQLARQHTKWSVEVMRTASIPMVMRRAFKVAAQPPTGPVLVSVPMDILANSEEMDIPPASHLYSQNRPDPVAVTKAASLLANSKNPAIYVGDRVAQSHAVAEVVTLAETLGARVYVNGMTAELNFPMNHPLFMGVNRFGDANTSKLLADVDVVLIVGTNPGSHIYIHHEAPFPATIKMIHLDIDPWEVAKNYPVELGIIADCKAGLVDLIDSVGDTMSAAQRQAASGRAAAIGQKTAQRQEVAEKEAHASWNNTPISLPRLMMELKKAIEPGTVIVHEALPSRAALFQYLAPSEPGTYFHTPGGALGWGLPAALGIKLGAPERPVVGVIGDGSSMYSIQALWSAARYNIPVTYIILNNFRYDTLRIVYRRFQGREPDPQSFRDYIDLDSPNLDFTKVADAFGIRGRRVVEPDDLAPALKEALQSGEPMVVDVIVAPVP